VNRNLIIGLLFMIGFVGSIAGMVQYPKSVTWADIIWNFSSGILAGHFLTIASPPESWLSQRKDGAQ
jgi:hypothetical protein